VALPDLEQAVFVRGGTILPILLHEDCMALLPCKAKDIRFEIYPDSTAKATGTLNLDDGETLYYLSEKCRYTYSFDGSNFSVDDAPCPYLGDLPYVRTAVIYGVESAPQ